MKLDIEKKPIIQTKVMISQINNTVHDQQMKENLPKFVQLQLTYLGKGKYALLANQYESDNHKIIKTKTLKDGNKGIIFDYVFTKFFKIAD